MFFRCSFIAGNAKKENDGGVLGPFIWKDREREKKKIHFIPDFWCAIILHLTLLKGLYNYIYL